MRRLKRVNTRWKADLAYVIGIITSDGNLSPDGRHLNITSKDNEIVMMAKRILGLKNKIGIKARGGSKDKKYFVLQFGDISFYEFLLSIGLMPNKSRKLTKIDIPIEYFPDFLRGCMDGDGSYGFTIHPESKYPQWKIRLCSASPKFIEWMLLMTRQLVGIEGGTIYKQANKSTIILSFGKMDARKIIKFMYYERRLPSLKRKFRQAQKCLGRVA